jgi:hypothetical protein
LPSHPCCLVIALHSPRCRLTVASPSPRPPFRPPSSSSRPRPQSSPHGTATATAIAIGIVGRYPYRCCCHHQCRSSRGHLRCLRRRCPDVSVAGRSGGTATPAIIRDGPDGHTTKTRYGTASVVASAATEEEECGGCDGADPRRRLDDSLLRLAEGILLRLIVATTAGAAATAVGSTAIATMSMPAINIDALFIWREDREGDNGSGFAAEDDDDTDVEVGGLRALGQGILGGGGRQQRRRRRAGTTSTKKMSGRGRSLRGSVRGGRRHRCQRLAQSADHRRQPRRGRAGRIRCGRNDHRRGDDGGDDGTGDVSVTITTTNDYHTYNDETAHITA